MSLYSEIDETEQNTRKRLNPAISTIHDRDVYCASHFRHFEL